MTLDQNLPADIHFEYVGNLHIHSRYSDGAYSISAIAGAAKRAGLDFIIVNDHEYMTRDLHLEEEGLRGGVLVLMGLEIGGRFHHYLAFDLKQMVRGKHLSPQEVIDHVDSQGGFGFLAHPFEKGMPFVEKSVAYTWNDLSVTGYTGMCIWNFSSRWKERVKGPLHGLFFLLFKAQTLRGPSARTLAFWDSCCESRKTAAIGGSDAHGAPFRWGALRFTPLTYDYLLNSINVHILLREEISKDFEEAKRQVFSALKEGRLFIAHDNLAPAKGFRFHYISDDGVLMTMGEERSFAPGTLSAETPLKSEIRLHRNGEIIRKWRGRKASFRVQEKGVYRVALYRRLHLFGWRPWIFSNPIYLR